MPVLTSRCSRAAVTHSSLLGLKTALFHASALCEEKWECKWQKGANRYKSSDSCRKEYLEYAKRKKRSDLKKDLQGWRSLEISFDDVEEVFGSCFSGPSSKERKKRWGGGNADRNGQSSSGSQYQAEGTSTRKGHKKSQHKENENQSYTNIRDGQYFFFYSFGARRPKQQWSHFWTEFCDWDTSWNSWEEPSYRRERTEKKKSEATIGSPSDRKALGLSPTGPLTVEELKKAFRTAALKWHPDRHEGSTKGIAEEKFKLCGAAYKSLLNAFTSA